MKLTPLDIQQQQFMVRFRGFDVREVDLFLEQMAGAFEQLARENEALKEEILRLRRESQGLKKREETFRRAMLHSQKVLESMKENAEKQAELIIAEAEIKVVRCRFTAIVQIKQITIVDVQLLERGACSQTNPVQNQPAIVGGRDNGVG